MTIRATLPLLALSVLGLLAGCGPKEDTNAASGTGPAANGGETGAKAAGKPVKVAFVTNNSSDFWTIARKGTEKATQEDPAISVEFKMPGSNDVSLQKTILDDLLAKGIEGIAISPIDPGNQTQMLNDAAGKTLVVTQDSDAPESNRACYIGTDNIAAGRQAGEEIKKALPNGGNIMVFVGSIDAQNAKERYQGIQEALKGSNVKILDVRTDDTDRVKAKSNVSDALVKNPDLAAAVGLWSYNGPAIVNAIQESGKTGKVKIICFDEEAETLAGVQGGAVESTIVQQPYEFGYQSIKTMAAYIRGDKSVIPAEKKIIVPTLVVNKANVGEFSQKLKTLRGK